MSLTWNKTILGQFSLLAFNPVRSQWGHYDIPRYIMKNNNSPKKVTQLRWGWKVRAVTSRPKKSAAATVQLCRAVILHIHYSFFKRQTSFDKFWRTTWTFGKKNTEIDHFSLNKSTKSMESAHGHQLRVIHRAHPLYVWMSHPLLPPWRLRHHCPPASPDLRSRDDFNLAPKIEN